MNADSAHKSNWEIAEVVFGIPFLLSIALQFIVPCSLPQGTLRIVHVPLGIVFIIMGFGMIVSARREFTRYHQPTDPGQPTSKVIKTGLFSISRNPLYLGAAILICGIGLAFNNLWILAALLVSIILCHYVLIVPEEDYLASKFGEEYSEYKHSVRRWVGRKSNPQSGGQPFAGDTGRDHTTRIGIPEE